MARQSLALPKSHSRNESPFEFSRDFAGFGHIDAKADSRLLLFGELIPKRRQAVRVRAETSRANGFAHGPEKANRAFGDDDVRRGVLQFHPEKSISGQGRHRINAAAEGSAEMIRIQ